jgi:hypothetical protein
MNDKMAGIVVRFTGLLLIIGLFYGTSAKAVPCPVKDVVVERDVIDTAVNVGLISLEEALQLRKDIADGKKDVIDVNSDEGIISFGTITYDIEDLDADPEEGEYIDGEWYDAYH